MPRSSTAPMTSPSPRGGGWLRRPAWSGMTFLRIVIPLYLFCLSMISAQTLRVCREGKPVPTFPDHAPDEMRSQDRHGRQKFPLAWPSFRLMPSYYRRLYAYAWG